MYAYFGIHIQSRWSWDLYFARLMLYFSRRMSCVTPVAFLVLCMFLCMVRESPQPRVGCSLQMTMKH